MACHSCNFNVEGFENNKTNEAPCPSYIPNNTNSKDSRFHGNFQFPVQNCIYTAQGMMICNKESKEMPNLTADIHLNTNQPFYNQTISEKYKYSLN